MTTAELQRQAIEHLRAGRMEGVEDACRRIIAAEPGHADAHNLLGIALHQQGASIEAAQCIAQAIALNANHAGYHNNLGKVLLEQGRAAEAIGSFRAAIRLQPDLPQAHLHLASALAAAGRHQEAVDVLETVIRREPGALAARNELGAVLREAGRFDEAAKVFEQAVTLAPASAALHVNLGNVYQDQGRTSDAIACFRRALYLAPDSAQAHNALGAALQVQGDINAAQSSYERALTIDPHHTAALRNLGTLQLQAGELAQAHATFARILALQPDDPEANYWSATIRLLQGDFAGSWAQYELRHKSKPAALLWWQGEALHGRRIMILPEGGLGDTLQFSRYVPLIQERGGDAWLVVQPPLLPLLQASGCSQVVSSTKAAPPCDAQVLMLSLPGIFNTTVETVPEMTRLLADELLVEQWGPKLSVHQGFKVGIHWHGSRPSAIDTRSIPLVEFEPLAGVPGVTLFSLQKGQGAEQLAEIGGRFRVIDLGEFDEASGPFMDTAAIVRNLDLVITNDTVIAHLAGGLGVPVWVALNVSPAWFWLQEREDTLWYPTMRLFREQRPFSWPEVMQRMAAKLARLLHDRA